MHLSGLLPLLRDSAGYRDLLTRLSTSTTQTIIRAARPFLLAALAQDCPVPIVYITARGKRAHNVAEQLPVWLAADRPILRFAEPTPMFYDRLAWDASVIQSRLEVLAALTQPTPTPPIIIASARAVMQRTLPVNLFTKKTQLIRHRQRHNLQALVQTWLHMGYQSATIVTEQGTFSRHGGILDIFPLAYEAPVRIEFFDDEIDTLRTFDPRTQRTLARLEQAVIVPAREALPELMPQVGRHLQAWFATVRQTTPDEMHPLLNDEEALLGGTAFPLLEHYLPYLYHQPASLLDYAPDEALIVLDEAEDVQTTWQEITQEAAHTRANNLMIQQLPEDYPAPYLEPADLLTDLAARRVLDLTVNTVQAEQVPSLKSEREFRGEVEDTTTRLFTPGTRYGGQLRMVLNQARQQRNAGEQVVLVTAQVERLRDLWVQQDNRGLLPKVEEIRERLPDGGLAVVEGTLGEGWTLTTENGTLHLLTDAEIFNWSRPEPRRRPTHKSGRGRNPEASYADWSAGDYVVHVDFGIGRFRGLQHRTVENIEREYLTIEYEGTDLLYVPIHQADRLTRYVGADDVPPKVNKLGKPAEWLKAKEKAKQAAIEEAKELLAIYARRASASGFAFQSDTPWQHELEASFPYVETDDQLRAIGEIKRDMENNLPMDRLVCGDVGYGKTEVALRAAFKAVMDTKQVAVLVPTTVLADQHYQTFQRRMAAFPVKIELLSRFRTKAEQDRAVQELSEGKIDVLVGTHRLLSKDVRFKDLGLVVIDEEQRFGVKHKEHFKKLRAQVDVLTLTATPIPRTLYITLSGIRDISMIQTPPEERLPIVTHVGSYDPKLARQAILRELERGGQVFIIHNRVQSLDQVRERFEELVPEASIIIAHGQMSGRQLEHVISEFSQGNYDILLATSIIENGIDMPNVNTLIVDRAELFGLAQLYQIRGRVGRGAQQGYCYFFHAGGRLTVEARERLATLAEYTDLGTGFQIAARDLELRGAGDILSTRQTGHMVSVGLQLYTQLLQQAVSELKGTATSTPTYAREQIILDLPIAAYIPNDWIQEMALRLQLYRRIGNLQTVEEIDVLATELRDRFGRLPEAVEGLLFQIRVKLLANLVNATGIVKPRQHILIKLPWLAGVNREALAAVLGDDVEVSRIAVELLPDPKTWRERLVQVLEKIREGLMQMA